MFSRNLVFFKTDAGGRRLARSGKTTGLTALVRSSLYVLRAEAKKRGVESGLPAEPFLRIL